MSEGQKKSILQKIADGIYPGLGLGIGIIVILGLYLIVRAVAPGAIKNPTFGPTDDDVALSPGQLECVSGIFGEGQTPAAFTSSLGNNYAFSAVFTGAFVAGQSSLTCINDWVLTGCAAAGAGSDNDESFVSQNTCNGDNEVGNQWAYARCCRIVP